MTPLGTSPEGKSIAEEIKHRLNWLTGLVVVLCVIVGGGSVYVYKTAQRNKDALCTVRADLQNRVMQTEDFIAHPDKFPGVKIKPEQLKPQLEDQKRTIEALSGLGCS